MFTIFTQRNTLIAMSSITCLTLTACASNPAEQVKSQASHDCQSIDCPSPHVDE